MNPKKIKESDKYRSNVEDRASTIKISEPKFQGINCYKETESPSVDSEEVTNAKGVARCPMGIKEILAGIVKQSRN